MKRFVTLMLLAVITLGARADYNSARESCDEVTPDVLVPLQEDVKADASDEVCLAPDKPAQYPGGEVAMMRWIAANLRYPPVAYENKIQGRVVLQIEISATGEVDKVNVIRDAAPDLNAEAVRVAKKMKGWVPGTYNGRPVRTKMNLPITFKL